MTIGLDLWAMLGRQVLISSGSAGVRLVVQQNPAVWLFHQQVDATTDSSAVRAIRFDGRLEVDGTARPALGYLGQERFDLGADGILVYRVSYRPGLQDAFYVWRWDAAKDRGACNAQMERRAQRRHVRLACQA